MRRLLFVPAGLILLLLFLFYGPMESFRLLWINTAMYTSRHKFLAEWFFTGKYINRVLAQNQPLEEYRTDDTALTNAWDDGIIFAEIRGNYFRGHIIKINDPRRLIFVRSDTEEGYDLDQFAEAHNALGGINASGYADPDRRGIAWGIIIDDGQVYSRLSRGGRHVMGGFTEEHKLVVGSFSEDEILMQQYTWALEFGPILIVNGEKTEFPSYYGGFAPRTAIGQTAEGHVLLLTIEGRQRTSIGATFQDLQTILYANGAVNAINLDGGSSTSMVYQGNLISSLSGRNTERLLPNAILFR